jgi:hypothetical protein
MRQFDICTAFLNRELEEEVFMRLPLSAEGLVGGGGRELHLKGRSTSCAKQLVPGISVLRGDSAKRVLCSPMLILHCGFCLGMGVPCL